MLFFWLRLNILRPVPNAAPFMRRTYDRRAAFESVQFGRLDLERQTTLNSAGSAALCDNGAATDSYGVLLMRRT